MTHIGTLALQTKALTKALDATAEAFRKFRPTWDRFITAIRGHDGLWHWQDTVELMEIEMTYEAALEILIKCGEIAVNEMEARLDNEREGDFEEIETLREAVATVKAGRP